MKRTIFYLLTLIIFPLNAEIAELEHFIDASEYLTKETLLIVDIDDTLVTPVQMLGSGGWFYSRYQTHIKEGLKAQQALNSTLSEWIAVHHITQMKIVEEGTDRILRDWQNQAISVMALTSQGLASADHTREQLMENGIDLGRTAPISSSHYWDGSVLYRNGILFASGHSKGETLSLLCKKYNYIPKKIVFIDDRAEALLEVEQFAKENGIEFVGLRYAYADRHKAAFNEEIADIQFTHSSFKRLLSDEEAARLLAKKKIGF